MSDTAYFPGTDIPFPIVVTPADAVARRSELASALHALADAVENGTFDFAGKTITINIDYTDSAIIPRGDWAEA